MVPRGSPLGGVRGKAPALLSRRWPWSTMRNLFLSSNGTEKPMPSHHMTPRPCMKVVWHSFQLKPMFPGGPHSRMIFW